MTFESDMLQHTCLKMFQDFHLDVSQDEAIKHINYLEDERMQTVQELLTLNYFQKQQIIGLIEAIIRLDQICKEHLLTIKRVDFSPQNIYFDPLLDDFVWRYIPDKSFNCSYGSIELIIHALIESGVIKLLMLMNDFTFDLLTRQSFSLETLYELLQKNEVERQTVKRPWKLFKTPKSFTVAEASSSITSHNASYPILLNKANPLESHKLYFDHNTVGRDACNNVFLDISSVSRKHAILFKDGYQMKIKDLKSTNGTYVNGKRLMGEIAIENGDSIKVGEKEFIFIR
jgi:hypothetical protein